jgi:aldose 1-epimerase
MRGRRPDAFKRANCKVSAISWREALMRVPPTDARAPQVFTIGSAGDLTIQVMDVGATWASCRVAMPDGTRREVLLGHCDPRHHLSEPGYLGAVIGRYANRIADGRFRLDGREVLLARNEGRNQLHGGPVGFHARRWDVGLSTAREVHLHLVSPDGDQGFPGALDVQVRYEVAARRAVRVEFEALCSAPCPVNLTSHAYFNLDGDGRSALDHQLQIAAHRFIPIDGSMIPAGNPATVTGTPLDFMAPRRIRERLHQGEQQALASGYDHCFVLDDASMGGPGRTYAARAWSSDRRLVMSLYTDYPGLQFYSGNHLARTIGRDGRAYAAHAGIALEPQYMPDSPNRPDWPQSSCVLRPGRRMQHFIEFRFEAA